MVVLTSRSRRPYCKHCKQNEDANDHNHQEAASRQVHADLLVRKIVGHSLATPVPECYRLRRLLSTPELPASLPHRLHPLDDDATTVVYETVRTTVWEDD